MGAPENPTAFPHLNPNFDGNWDKEPQRGGMTLRDWFAGQALNQLCKYGPGGHASADLTAEAAYEYADAMLAARAKAGGA